jgi:hypothetical protein
MHEDDILRLWWCLGGGDPIEQGKGSTSSDSLINVRRFIVTLLLSYDLSALC